MSASRIKSQFFAGNKKKYQKTFYETFYFSNDHFPLTFLPASAKIKNSLTILVGPSDVLSILHLLDDNILICDIDTHLLDHLNQQKSLLLQWYEKYNNNECTFAQAAEAYRRWLGYEFSIAVAAKKREKNLGHHFFLFSEENYQRTMQALQQKDLATLAVDLFHTEEQQQLARLIRDEKLSVNIVNWTNLPDYDTQDSMIDLVNRLPFSEQPYIVWNIHDRGPTKKDAGTHRMQYLFVARSPLEFITHVKTKPHFFCGY